MQTLKNDLERAIPHFDTTADAIAGLTRDGQQALRRRRTRVTGAIATGGLAVAGAAVASALMVGQSGPNTGSATPDGVTPRTTTPSQPVEAEFSLASLQQVADACGDFTVNRESQMRLLTSDGQAVEESERASGDGWTAAQYDCGSDIIRLVEADDRGLVGRYPASEDEPLSVWAEENVERLRQ